MLRRPPEISAHWRSLSNSLTAKIGVLVDRSKESVAGAEMSYLAFFVNGQQVRDSLAVVLPEDAVPVVCLSLHASLDPAVDEIEQMQRAVVDSSNSLINNSHASHTLYDQSIEYSVDGAMLEPPSHMLSAARLYGRGIAQKTLPPFGSSSKKGPPPEFYIPVNVAFVPGRCM